MSHSPTVFAPAFLHGTKADLKVGDLISVGYESNFLDGASLSWVYFTATLDAAIWGAELAKGDGRARIYLVEATGAYEDDPNLTDKKFPGNPTLSYRSREPLRVIGEVLHWQGHSSEEIQKRKDGLEKLKALGAAVIID
jgi:DNA/RNA tunnel of bacterial DNA dependent RNA polymerase.